MSGDSKQGRAGFACGFPSLPVLAKHASPFFTPRCFQRAQEPRCCPEAKQMQFAPADGRQTEHDGGSPAISENGITRALALGSLVASCQ